MVLPEAHASEGKPISSPGRSRFTDSLAPPRTQQSISLKHRLHSTSKLDLRDHCSDHGSVRPQNPRMLLTKKNPFLFLVTRFFFLETNSRFRWPKAATATSGVHPTVFSLPRWQPGDAPPSTMRRGSFSPPSSLGGVVSNGPATMDPSSPPLTFVNMSLWQMPHANTETRASPGPGPGYFRALQSRNQRQVSEPGLPHFWMRLISILRRKSS